MFLTKLQKRQIPKKGFALFKEKYRPNFMNAIYLFL
jgi:hypothetical protein